uniref:Allorecognition 2 n=1 Tax=Panagrolaimus sp. ES5 TaxID=591445 RepID=A0AC34G0L2_9BILA
MFLAGLYPPELNNYLFYESDTPTNENLVGSLADEKLFVGNNSNKWYIPLLYSAKTKAVTIVKNNETVTIENSVLFFRIPQVHKCGTHKKDVFQPTAKDYFFIEALISAPNDSSCQFTVITYKQRPRRLVIQFLETNSTEVIKVYGGTFNKSFDYFQLDTHTADDYSNLNLFGSVFTFNIPQAQKAIVSYAGQSDEDHGKF